MRLSRNGGLRTCRKWQCRTSQACDGRISEGSSLGSATALSSQTTIRVGDHYWHWFSTPVTPSMKCTLRIISAITCWSFIAPDKIELPAQRRLHARYDQLIDDLGPRLWRLLECPTLDHAHDVLDASLRRYTLRIERVA